MNINDPIGNHFRLNEYQTSALKRLKLETIEDLLYHLPSRYADMGAGKKIVDLEAGEKVTLYGTLSKLKAKKLWKSKKPASTGVLTDESGTITITWFHQPYLAKMIPEGSLVKVEGAVTEYNGALTMTNPECERVADMPTADDSLFSESDSNNETHLFPVYRESRGVTSKWFYYALQRILGAGVHEQFTDPIPKEILEKYNLPSLASAFIWIHTPHTKRDARAAHKRFAFEEVFVIQLKKQQDRARALAEPSFEIDPLPETIEKFIERFPFTPTAAQTRAVNEIIADISSPHAMGRLLEGDVGAGKTFVAAVTSYAVVTTAPKNVDGIKQDFGNLQIAYMAPTEILATQLYESFIEMFRGLPIKIALITGSGCRKFPSKVDPNTWTDISKPQLLKWVKNGEIPIVIGTHALIQKSVEFKDLAYVIIDEQHRFGTNQRSTLVRNTDARLPHLLSMTATPIPRTLALTIYGDLDLTLLDEKPAGRKDIITEIVPESEQARAYDRVRDELRTGRQAYVICPRINEPDPSKENALQLKSVKEETKRLQTDVFPNYSVDMLHGGMSAKVKDEQMKKFERGEIDILVATSVVEVGVNVPNATIIIIEGAERFGLAQLHQLRGRVQRSSHQSYCYLFPNTKSEHSLKRLDALARAANGFDLAEYDLAFRGTGDLYGNKQWGISDIGMEAIKNIKMVEAARTEAARLIADDPDLASLPDLRRHVELRGDVHFE